MLVTLILFIFILGIIIMVHELGHFLLAKKVGVHVYEFSIGMGPKVYSWFGKDKTKYSIRGIPIGGYVSLAGETNEDDPNVPKGGKLQDKTIFERFLVMVMGATFNFILAILLFLAIGLFFGSSNLEPVIYDVQENYPAYEEGVSKGDKVLNINNHKIKYIDDISLYLSVADMTEEVEIQVEKTSGEIINYKIMPEAEEAEDGVISYSLGIVLQPETKTGFINSVKYSIGETHATFKQMRVVLTSLFTRDVSLKQLSGPVGIYNFVGQMEDEGISSILYLIAILSINIGFINLLPFPAFDGGRILFLLIEKIKGSPINSKTENIIHTIGFVLIMILMIYITFNDIFKLF